MVGGTISNLLFKTWQNSVGPGLLELAPSTCPGLSATLAVTVCFSSLIHLVHLSL